MCSHLLPRPRASFRFGDDIVAPPVRSHATALPLPVQAVLSSSFCTSHQSQQPFDDPSPATSHHKHWYTTVSSTTLLQMSAATPIVGDVHPEVVDGVIPKSQPTATPIAQPPTTVPASPSQAIGTHLRGVSNSLNSARSSVAVTRAREHGAKVSAALGGARQRAVELGNHPVAVRAQGIASANANRARDILGRSETIRSAEKLTGIDRLLLVIGGNVL